MEVVGYMVRNRRLYKNFCERREAKQRQVIGKCKYRRDENEKKKKRITSLSSALH